LNLSSLMRYIFVCGIRLTDRCKKNADTRDEFLTRILDAVVRINKSEDHLKRITRDLRARVANVLMLIVGFRNIYCEL
jgi:hypothetical protein